MTRKLIAQLPEEVGVEHIVLINAPLVQRSSRGIVMRKLIAQLPVPAGAELIVLINARLVRKNSRGIAALRASVLV